nr:ribosomal protein S5 domain 2-like protein [Cryptomonas sp.]
MCIFTHERNNYLNIYKNGIRNDGRNFNKCRSLNIILGPKGGFNEIQQGNTRVVVSSFIQPTYCSPKGDSDFVFSFEIKMPRNKKYKSIEYPQKNCHDNCIYINEIVRLLNSIYNNEKYSFFKTTHVFTDNIHLVVKFKIFIIEDHGNIKDVIIAGISISLYTLKEYAYIINGQILNVNSNYDHLSNLKCTICSFPLSFSFGIIETWEGEFLIIFDPNDYEENLSISIITIVLTFNDKLICIFSGVGPGSDENIIKEAIRISLTRNNGIKNTLRDILNIKTTNDLVNEISFIIQ